MPYIEWFLSTKNSCHLHCQAGYICWDITTTLLQRVHCNEYTAIFQKYVRNLTKRCENVAKTLDVRLIFNIEKKNIWIKYFTLFSIICFFDIELFLSIENLCHLHSDSKYILANVATRLLQRLSQISSAKLSSNVVKMLCVSWNMRYFWTLWRTFNIMLFFLYYIFHVMTYFLTAWCTFHAFWCPDITSWRHDMLYDIMMYFLYFLTSWSIFAYFLTNDVIVYFLTYLLTSRHSFWHHYVLYLVFEVTFFLTLWRNFWQNGILYVLFDVMTYFWRYSVVFDVMTYIFYIMVYFLYVMTYFWTAWRAFYVMQIILGFDIS